MIAATRVTYYVGFRILDNVWIFKPMTPIAVTPLFVKFYLSFLFAYSKNFMCPA